jgi:hypothetical protein
LVDANGVLVLLKFLNQPFDKSDNEGKKEAKDDKETEVKTHLD